MSIILPNNIEYPDLTRIPERDFQGFKFNYPLHIKHKYVLLVLPIIPNMSANSIWVQYLSVNINGETLDNDMWFSFQSIASIGLSPPTNIQILLYKQGNFTIPKYNGSRSNFDLDSFVKRYGLVLEKTLNYTIV